MNKKNLVIALSLVVIIIISIVIIWTTISNSTNNNQNNNTQNNGTNNSVNTKYKEVVISDDFFDITNPMKIKKNGKFGFINTNGDIIIEPKYDGAIDFYGDYALVKEGIQKKIIDRNDKKILSVYSINYKNVSFGNYIIDSKLYNLKLEQLSPENYIVDETIGGGYYLITNNQDSSIINAYGEIIYTLDGEFTVELIKDTIGYHYAKIEYDNTTSIIDLLSGTQLYKLKDNETLIKNSSVEPIVIINKGDAKKLMAFENGKSIFELEENNVDIAYYNKLGNYIKIYYNNKEKKIYDIKTKKYIDYDTSFEGFSGFSNIYPMERYGYSIDLTEPDTDDNVLFFKRGMATISKNKDVIYSDKVKFFNVLDERLFQYFMEKYNIGYTYYDYNNTDEANTRNKIFDLVSKQIVFDENKNNDNALKKFSTYDDKTPFLIYRNTSQIMKVTNGISKVFSLFSKNILELTNEVNLNTDGGSTYIILQDGDNYNYYNYKLEKVYESNENPWSHI